MLSVVDHRIDGAAYRAAAQIGRSIVPTIVVVHDTAGSLARGNVVSYFAKSGCKVSAHIVVETDGSYTQMVPFDRRGAHAGVSNWKGRADCNAFAIGIEIVNPGMMERRGNEVLLIYREKDKRGKPVEKIVSRYKLADCVEVETAEHGHGWCLPYTYEQIEAVKEICRALCTAYAISDIVGHFHISPKRKTDVTPLFPMDEVRDYAFAVPEDASAPVAVVDEAVPPVKPEPAGVGMLASLPFSAISEFIEQGSRLGSRIQAFFRTWWLVFVGGTAVTVAGDPSKGSKGALAKWISANPLLSVLIVFCVAMALTYIGLWVVRHYFLTAAKAGRYKPEPPKPAKS